MLSVAFSIAVNPAAASDAVMHPSRVLHALARPSWAVALPVLWTGLLSTDAVLLIEVTSCMPLILLPSHLLTRQMPDHFLAGNCAAVGERHRCVYHLLAGAGECLTKWVSYKY